MTVSAVPQPLRVLVVDDERIARQMTLLQLRDEGFVAAAVDNGYAALERLGDDPWDVVLCDLRMPGMDGLQLLETIRRDHEGVEVVLMTAYGTVETAVEAMLGGAADYLTKPFHFRELQHRLQRIATLREFRLELESLRALLDDGGGRAGIVGEHPAMRQVVERVHTFAGHDAPVLVTGETGTGKEVVARALHDTGARSQGPFVPVACGAIPASLAESELFGHEKGAFSGAVARRTGAFERASGGTLLLDDVDDLPPDIQVKLLRALQEERFARVGGSREIQVDVRVVATTKVDLEESVARGDFRADLFYRLRGLEIGLPRLRERGDDVLLLAQHFLQRQAKRDGREVPSLRPDAADCLRRHPWPGNVRELRHAMEAAMVLAGEEPIDRRHLPAYLQADADCPGDGVVSVHLGGRESVSLNEVVRDVEDTLVRWAMQRAGGQQTRAADLLGLPRTTFQSKLSRLEERDAEGSPRRQADSGA